MDDDTTKWDFAVMTLPAITDNVNHAMTLYAKWETDPYATDDFGVAALIDDAFTVTDEPAWNAARAAISNGGNNKNYIINLGGNFAVDGLLSGWSFGTRSGIKVSLRGGGAHTLSLSTGNGSLLRVNGGQTLILRDLTLKGRGGNEAPLVCVDGASASLSMAGATIRDNANISGSNSSGGVYFNGGSGGSFTMTAGATISGNSGSSGGGVYVYNGDFTMTDGEISGNSTTGSGYGGGVYVATNGSFTMKTGATISGGNTATSGGGVYVSGGSFTMDGGVISGNSATGSGGGVYVYNGAFTMTDGEISGNTAVTNGGGVYAQNGGSYDFIFSKSGGGIIYGDYDTTHTAGADENTATSAASGSGHAVYYYGDSSSKYYCDITLYAADSISTGTVPPNPPGSSFGNWIKQ
jgi:hypothetical protein